METKEQLLSKLKTIEEKEKKEAEQTTKQLQQELRKELDKNRSVNFADKKNIEVKIAGAISDEHKFTFKQLAALDKILETGKATFVIHEWDGNVLYAFSSSFEKNPSDSFEPIDKGRPSTAVCEPKDGEAIFSFAYYKDENKVWIYPASEIHAW